MDTINFDEIETELNNQPELSNELADLITEIDTQKWLVFEEAVVFTKFPKLFANKILVRQQISVGGKSVWIGRNNIFLFSFYKNFASKFSFELSSDIDKILQFVEQIGAYLTVSGPRSGITELTNNLIVFLLQAATQYHNADAHLYVMKLENQPLSQSSNQFLYVYLKVFESSSLGPERAWTVISHVAVLIGGPKYGTIDITWSKVTSAVVNYCQNNPSECARLRLVAFQNINEPTKRELIQPILNGSIKAKDISVEEVISLLEERDKAEFVINALLVNIPANQVQIEKIFSKLEHLDNFTYNTLLQIPRFLLALLKPAESDLKKRLRARFEELMFSDNERLLGISFESIIHYDGDSEDDFFISLLKKVVETTKVSEQTVGWLDGFFLNHGTLTQLFEFIKYFAPKVGLNFKEALFEHSLDKNYHERRPEFERAVVELVIDPNGLVRWAGHRILFGRSGLSERLTLSIDLLQYSALDQLKFVNSVVTPFEQVNKTIPLVAPLLATTFPMVANSLLVRLRELIDAYKFEALETFKKELEQIKPDIENKNQIVQELTTFLNDLGDRISKTVSIRELDPNYNQRALMRTYFEAYSKNSAAESRLARSKHKGIINMVTNVGVARGGGFKVPGTSKVTPLQKVSISFTMPRTIWIRPEVMDYIRINHFTENLTDLYTQWEQTLSL
jgi:hypothetical protein